VLLAFADEVTELACTTAARAEVLWGATGARLMGRCVSLLTCSATVGQARTFQVACFALARCGDLCALVISCEAAELFTVPTDHDGLLHPPKQEDDVDALDDVQCLQVFAARCGGRAAAHPRAAA
jgi:hypothetical protein